MNTRKGTPYIAAGLLAITGVLLYKLTAEAQDPELASLSGTVYDEETMSPIPSIVATMNGYQKVTGSNGSFNFLNIAPGEYSILFTDPLGRYEEYAL